jgi:acetyl esterase/lipase
VTALNGKLKLPERTASKEEWDKFDAELDQVYREHYVTQTLSTYPVDIADTQMAGVHVGVITPKGGTNALNQCCVLINLHGGGFLVNRGLTFGELEAIPVAAIGKLKVITIDYREAPGFKYPAASEDMEAVYRELLKTYRSKSIGIFGCSSGGVLAAQAVAWIQQKRLPSPGAIGIFCAGIPTPASSGTHSGDSAIWSTLGVIQAPRQVDIRGGGATSVWSLYLEDVSAGDAVAYPGASDATLRSFPSTLFLNGTRDPTLSAALVSHARLLNLGVDSYLYVIEGGWHAAHFMATGTPEARNANIYIARWFKSHLAH